MIDYNPVTAVELRNSCRHREVQFSLNLVNHPEHGIFLLLNEFSPGLHRQPIRKFMSCGRNAVTVSYNYSPTVQV